MSAIGEYAMNCNAALISTTKEHNVTWNHLNQAGTKEDRHAQSKNVRTKTRKGCSGFVASLDCMVLGMINTDCINSEVNSLILLQASPQHLIHITLIGK